MGRILCGEFKSALLTGCLQPLLECVNGDPDLIIEIRDAYINIYFKGHNVALVEYGNGTYPVSYTQKFITKLLVSTPQYLSTMKETELLLKAIPGIKDNISRHVGKGAEIEFEQMVIRANNNESSANTDYFMLDRQVQIPGEDDRLRFDLLGFYWPTKDRNTRRITVPLVIAEVKYACNTDIQELRSQISSYYSLAEKHMHEIAYEAAELLKLKLELGLLTGNYMRADALSTLRIMPDISKTHFLIILVDYNPNSDLLQRAEINKLDFSDQIRIFYTGFGLWTKYEVKIADESV